MSASSTQFTFLDVVDRHGGRSGGGAGWLGREDHEPLAGTRQLQSRGNGLRDSVLRELHTDRRVFAEAGDDRLAQAARVSAIRSLDHRKGLICYRVPRLTRADGPKAGHPDRRVCGRAVHEAAELLVGPDGGLAPLGASRSRLGQCRQEDGHPECQREPAQGRLRGAGPGGASTAAGPKASRRALPDGSHAVWIDTSNAASSSRVHPGWCSGTSNASGGIRRVVVWAGFVLLAAPLLAGRRALHERVALLPGLGRRRRDVRRCVAADARPAGACPARGPRRADRRRLVGHQPREPCCRTQKRSGVTFGERGSPRRERRWPSREAFGGRMPAARRGGHLPASCAWLSPAPQRWNE